VKGSETILIVEDQRDVRKLAVTALRSYEYTVLEAADAEEALAVCKQMDGAIHLVLTDVVMPGRSGPELVKAINRLYPQMRVVFMSGYTESAILQNNMVADSIVHIDKPFTARDLAVKVREALDDQPAPGAPHARS
jgi:DNA-binding NtrC family response regulator